MCSPVMWSALTSATSTGCSGTGRRSLPDQRLEQPPDLGSILVEAHAADVVQPTLFVVEPEQQMLHRLGGALPVETGHDAVDGLPELELPHRSLAGQVGQIAPLCDDAVE